jgi:hypothetical protein
VGEGVNLSGESVNSDTPSEQGETGVSATTVTLKADPGIDVAGTERFLSEVFGRSAGVIEVAAFLQGSKTKPVCAFRRIGETIHRHDGTSYALSPAMLAEAVSLGDKGITQGTEQQPVDAWYVRMTTLATEPEGGRRGGAANIREFFGFWLDGDFDQDGHHTTDGKDGTTSLPPDADAVRELWQAAGYPPPTIEWMTGGGVNGLWLLDEPIRIEDGTEGKELFTLLKAASRRWHERVRMVAFQEGYHHDSVGNLDRLMRLPGSVNRKVMHDPKAVTATYGGPRYNLTDLMDLIPEPQRTDDGALIDPVSGQLLQAAPERVHVPGPRGSSATSGAPIEGLTPWDDFDARADWWGHVLGPLGFQHHSWSGQTENLTRPGKDPSQGQSATLNHDGLDKLYLFSDTVERENPSNRAYTQQYMTKSQALCHIVHGGDWTKLARDLRGRGFGEALPQPPRSEALAAEPVDLFAGQTAADGTFVSQSSRVTPDAALAEAVPGMAPDATPRDNPEEAQIVFRRASDVRLRRTEWMWDTTPEGGQPTSGGRIPKDMLTVAAGLPGTGKSQWAIWITARITRGTLPGAHYGQPKNVIYAATEDDWERTIAPRLVAAGADLERVFHVMVRTVEMKTIKLCVPDHVHQIGKFAQQQDVALVVLDPLLSHLGGKINANAEREVRDALEPLVKAAARYCFTVLGLSHFNKNSGNADPMERLMGSRGFSALLRALIVFAKDKDAEEGDAEIPMQKFVLSQAKNNLGRTDMPSYEYTIMPSVVDTEEGPAYVSHFALGPESETSVEEQLGSSSRSAEEQAIGRDCKSWLKGYLQHQGGEDFQADIITAAEKEGYSRATLYRARETLKLGGKTTGFGAAKVTVWRLPGAITQGRKADAQRPPLHAAAPKTSVHPPQPEPARQEWTVERIPDGEPDDTDREE